MKLSSRALRKKRHYSRMHRAGGLNLVSLMDIFTILVFFLMVNSTEVQVLQQNAAIKLPKSVADQSPRETLTVTVTNKDIVVAGRPVLSLLDLEKDENELIAGLKQELDYQASRAHGAGEGQAEERPITIMADRELPYQMLKKIMATCVSSGYSLISLAVTKATESGV